MPEDSRKGRGGTSPGTGRERQASAAVTETSRPETTMLLEEVLRRENLVKAYHKVRANKGAPGVDGMTVDDLKAPFVNRRMPNGTYGGVRGRGREAPAYSIRAPQYAQNGPVTGPELNVLGCPSMPI